MQTTHDIRRAFLEYFGQNGHEVVASSPLIPHHDPSLLFINAGMVPFKNVFTGQETRPYNRATSCQKCLRAGGKHNDLENVGFTARHHTFFEMLGNFSFGDYFKESAIFYAWTFITQEMGISPERLWVTVYAEDEEAFGLWKRIAGLPDARIIRIATTDNFWSMGDTGPCGPCSEIFYDHGPSIPGGPPGSPDQDGDRFVEIWNLVFMQYEQRSASERVLLPKPSIDTGMGLERIAAVLQGVHDNYDTDILKRLVDASAKITHRPAINAARFSHRVIADHMRSAAFLIADGILPSNEGRGYVLRRILRRALRHVHLLGYRDVLLSQLVPVLDEMMGAAYPELSRAAPLMKQTLDLEEKRFRQTLDRGLRLLQEETATLGTQAALPGEVAFKLYDTYGFPLDLTETMMKEEGRSVDLKGFEDAMARQKAEARASWVGSGEATTDQVYFEIKQQVGATEFLGYFCEEAQGTIQALILDRQSVSSAKEGPGKALTVIVNQTPFYGESGGQMGDSGRIFSIHGAEIQVHHTQKKQGLHLHQGTVLKGTVRVGEEITLQIDSAQRAQLKANHSATHLLHTALRRCLGAHVTQKGSLVSPERLRFDFSHAHPLTPEELRRIEQDVNGQIRQNHPVCTQIMAPQEAIQAGALALFGEKYGEEVRVVSMGALENQHFSVELCGGTHVTRTGDIGFFKIISESGLAAGIRRIEAVTGVGSEQYVATQQEILRQCADLLKVAPDKMSERLNQLLEERKQVAQELSQMRQKMVTSGGTSGILLREKRGDMTLLVQQTEGLSSKDLKGIMDQLKQQVSSGILLLINTEDIKSTILVGVTQDLLHRFNAVSLLAQIASAWDGQGGGGRPDLAQASGPTKEKIPTVIAFFQKII